jgi:hypothetical protein
VLYVLVDSDSGRAGGGRYEPYPPPRHADPPVFRAAPVAVPSDRERQQARDDYASEQVKDLLELYFRDPYAFDQYAKTYYYGERAERERAAKSFYDRRPVELYVSFESLISTSKHAYMLLRECRSKLVCMLLIECGSKHVYMLLREYMHTWYLESLAISLYTCYLESVTVSLYTCYLQSVAVSMHTCYLESVEVSLYACYL